MILFLASGGVMSGTGSLAGGLLGLTNYLGNIILPIISGLCLVLAARTYMQRRGDGERYVIGAIAALLASSFVRLAGVFTSQSTGPNEYYYAILTLTNWLGNVVMPTVAVLAFVRAILAYGGAFQRIQRGQAWERYVVVGFMCLSISGILHFLEYLVQNAR